METIQPEFVSVHRVSHYKPLSENDTLVFEKYKNKINDKIRETFPSIPADFELKPVVVCRIQGCGTFYHYKVALPDNKFAKVSFNTGGMYIQPPDAKNYEPPDPSFTVDPMLTSTPDE